MLRQRWGRSGSTATPPTCSVPSCSPTRTGTLLDMEWWTLIGGAIGGAAVFVGTWVKEVVTRRAAAREREEERSEARDAAHRAELREAYATLIPAYQNLLELGLQVVEQVDFIIARETRRIRSCCTERRRARRGGRSQRACVRTASDRTHTETLRRNAGRAKGGARSGRASFDGRGRSRDCASATRCDERPARPHRSVHEIALAPSRRSSSLAPGESNRTTHTPPRRSLRAEETSSRASYEVESQASLRRPRPLVEVSEGQTKPRPKQAKRVWPFFGQRAGSQFHSGDTDGTKADSKLRESLQGGVVQHVCLNYPQASKPSSGARQLANQAALPSGATSSAATPLPRTVVSAERAPSITTIRRSGSSMLFAASKTCVGRSRRCASAT